MVKVDISDEIELKNGRANACGWSQKEVWHDGKQIGWLYCGELKDFVDGYSFEIKEIDSKTVRGIIYKHFADEETAALDKNAKDLIQNFLGEK